MNQQAILRQAQMMQKEIEKAQKSIESSTFEGQNALVKVKISGKRKILEVNIDKSSSLEKEDLEALEDMFMLATNEAFSKLDKMTEEKMGKYASIPGLF